MEIINYVIKQDSFYYYDFPNTTRLRYLTSDGVVYVLMPTNMSCGVFYNAADMESKRKQIYLNG